MKSNINLKNITRVDRQQEIIPYNHETKEKLRGVEERIAQFKSKSYYWPKLDSDIKNYVNRFDNCQQINYQRHQHHLQLQITHTPSRPVENIHVDVLQSRQQEFCAFFNTFPNMA